MQFVRNTAISAIFIAMLGYASAAALDLEHTGVQSQEKQKKEKQKKTKSGIDYEGMLSLVDVKPPPIRADIGFDAVMVLTRTEGKPELKTRLLVNTDGTVSKATSLGGSKILMRNIRKALLSIEFYISPDAISGPWEVDMEIKKSSEMPKDFPPELILQMPAVRSGVNVRLVSVSFPIALRFNNFQPVSKA